MDKTPAPALDDGTLEALRDAVVAGYSRPELADRLRFRWGFRLEDEFDPHQGYKFVVGDLLGYTEREGRTADLLALLWAKRPNNPRLRPLAERLLPDPAAALATHGDRPRIDPLPGRLEALVSTRSRLVDWGAFTARVAAIGRRVCRVDLPGGEHGTGFLIGAAQVLTNHHVARPLIERLADPTEAVVRFDLWEDGRGDGDGTPVRLAEAWEGRSRRFSASDESGSGDPAPDELDYAVLNLAEPVGGAAPNAADGDGRGWFAPSPRIPIVAVADVAMIPQHPGGEPLKVAYGSVIELPKGGLRYRYDVTTDRGSSGSPVFSADLDPIGLHHAADPAADPAYNQAVPLWRIARDLAGAAGGA